VSSALPAVERTASATGWLIRPEQAAASLGGWPLPTAGGQPWPRLESLTRVRPNWFSAVGSENTWKNRTSYCQRLFQLFPRGSRW